MWGLLLVIRQSKGTQGKLKCYVSVTGFRRNQYPDISLSGCVCSFGRILHHVLIMHLVPRDWKVILSHMNTGAPFKSQLLTKMLGIQVSVLGLLHCRLKNNIVAFAEQYGDETHYTIDITRYVYSIMSIITILFFKRQWPAPLSFVH